MAHVVLARPTKACASTSGGTLRSMRHQKYSFDPLNLNSCPRMGTAKASQKSRGTCGTCRAQSSPQVGPPEGDSGNAAQQEDFVALPDNFCIIESRESVKNFANMQMEELEENIQSRRNKIFLLMEEVRRLRVQQRMRSDPINAVEDESVNRESYPSFIPFFPPVNEETLKLYTNVYGLAVIGIILFGGLVAPSLEVKLGLGGLSYREFITMMHLPQQLAERKIIANSKQSKSVFIAKELDICPAEIVWDLVCRPTRSRGRARPVPSVQGLEKSCAQHACALESSWPQNMTRVWIHLR
ncbi:hypothetical protein M9434_005806 [Picochlorum sp. BPE23]|nr:hypothetical protein M9434_005806 [Picochlorum sp. BPE23]KAI8103558.1 hypothetical protein M9435_004893 [Picochlorum sp. BPE23]